MTQRVVPATVCAFIVLTMGLLDGQGSAGRPSVSGAGGTVEGVVTLGGSSPMPAATRIENSTDPEVCGRTHVLEDWVVSVRNRGIQHVILTIEGVAGDRVAAASPGPLVIDNRKCSFLPHASAITAGSALEMVNSDPVLHTVHLYGPVDLNIALPLKDMRVTRRIDATGMLVVKCDVHGWMQAYVKVNSHPFHVVSNASGSFRIENVPPGDYTLHAWHEKLGDRREPLRVQRGVVTKLNVTYQQQ